ncbi:hypothetical protein [Lutispora thermophila]|uniref:PH domain-containing protein n=1 Tax=Lutispora thermophila DSM 19022 TaxID=1122184 RepID=A0A1M6E8W7_9FIRM|nr:hypothetical protein [Lutispora thermophila]SHI81790.1 hypothetical protein SAMN02745176_01487 [Lutispora thermophila DSM 19022]
MTVYKGKASNLKGTSLVMLGFIAMILIIYFFTERGFLPWFFIISLALMCIPVYGGMILKITMDEKKVVIRRPLSWKTLKLSQIAFCAVHDIGEGKSTLFVFVKYKWGNDYRIKGVKSTMSYDEIIKALKKGGRIQDLKVNFNKAVKVPVSLVENGDELKERILDCVEGHHFNAVNN